MAWVAHADEAAAAGAPTAAAALLLVHLLALGLVLLTVGRRCPERTRGGAAARGRAPPAAAAPPPARASLHELCAAGDEDGGAEGGRAGPDASSSDDGVVSPRAASPCALPSPAAARARGGAAGGGGAPRPPPTDEAAAAAAALGGVSGVGAFGAPELLDALGLLDGFGRARPKYEIVISQPAAGRDGDLGAPAAGAGAAAAAAAQLRFLRRPLSATQNAFLTEGSLPDCPPERFLALWYDETFRTVWDEGLARFDALPCGAVHHAIKYPYPLQHRYYLYDRAVARVTRRARGAPWAVRAAWPAAARADAGARAAGPDDGADAAPPTPPAAAGAAHDDDDEEEVLLLLAKCAAPRLAEHAARSSGVLCSGLLSFTAVRRARAGTAAAAAAAGRGGGGCEGCEFAIFTLDEQGVPVPSWVLNSLLQHTYPQYMRRVHEAARTLGEREAEGRPLAELCPAMAPLLRAQCPAKPDAKRGR